MILTSAEMKPWRLFLFLLIALLSLKPSFLTAQTSRPPTLLVDLIKDGPPPPNVVAKLLSQLANPHYAEREKATEQLKNLGPGLLKSEIFLRNGVKGVNAEISDRAKSIFNHYAAQYTPYSPTQVVEELFAEARDFVSTVTDFNVDVKDLNSIGEQYKTAFEQDIISLKSVALRLRSIKGLVDKKFPKDSDNGLKSEIIQLSELRKSLVKKLIEGFIGFMRQDFFVNISSTLFEFYFAEEIFEVKKPNLKSDYIENNIEILTILPRSKKFSRDFKVTDILARKSKIPLSVQIDYLSKKFANAHFEIKIGLRTNLRHGQLFTYCGGYKLYTEDSMDDVMTKGLDMADLKKLITLNLQADLSRNLL